MANYTESDITTDEQAALDQIKEETEAAVKYDIAAKKAKDPVTKEAMEHNKKDEIEHAGLMGAVAVRENPENKEDMMNGVKELDSFLTKSVSRCIKERRERGTTEIFQKAYLKQGVTPKGIPEGVENLLSDDLRKQMAYLTSSPAMWNILSPGTTGAKENYYGTERGGVENKRVTRPQNLGVAGWNPWGYGIADPTEFQTYRSMLDQGRVDPRIYRLMMNRFVQPPQNPADLEDAGKAGEWISKHISKDPLIHTVRGVRGPNDRFSRDDYSGLDDYSIDALNDMIERNNVYKMGTAGNILGQSNNIIEDIEDVVNNLYTLLDYARKNNLPPQAEKAILKRISDYNIFASKLATAQFVDRMKQNVNGEFYPAESTYDDEGNLKTEGLYDAIERIYGPEAAQSIKGFVPIDKDGKEEAPEDSLLRSLLSEKYPSSQREQFLDYLRDMTTEEAESGKFNDAGKPIMERIPKRGTVFEGTNIADKSPEEFVYLFDFLREHPQALAEKPTDEKLIRDTKFDKFGIADQLTDDQIKAVLEAVKKDPTKMMDSDYDAVLNALGMKDPRNLDRTRLRKMLFEGDDRGLAGRIDRNKKAKPEWRNATPFDVARFLGADSFRTTGVGRAQNILDYVEKMKDRYGGSAGLLDALKKEDGTGIMDENGNEVSPKQIDEMTARLKDYIAKGGMEDREGGYNFDYSAIYDDPVYKFLYDAMNKSRRYREMSQEAMNARANEAADEYLEDDGTHDVEWNPDSGEPNPLDVGSARLQMNTENQKRGIEAGEKFVDDAWYDRDLAEGLLETLDTLNDDQVSNWERGYMEGQLRRVLSGDSRGWDWLYGTESLPTLLRAYAVNKTGGQFDEPALFKDRKASGAEKVGKRLLFEKENANLLDQLRKAGVMPNGLSRSTQDLENMLGMMDQDVVEPSRVPKGIKGASANLNKLPMEEIIEVLKTDPDQKEVRIDPSILSPSARNYEDSLKVIANLNNMLEDWTAYKENFDDLDEDELEDMKKIESVFPAYLHALVATQKGKVGEIPDPNDPKKKIDVDASSMVFDVSKDDLKNEFNRIMDRSFNNARENEGTESPLGGNYLDDLSLYSSNPELDKAVKFMNGSAKYSQMQNDAREMLAGKLGRSAMDWVIRAENEFDKEKAKNLEPGEKRKATRSNKLAYGMGEFKGIGKGINEAGEEVTVPVLAPRSAESLKTFYNMLKDSTDDAELMKNLKLTPEDYQVDMDRYIEDSENLKTTLRGRLGDDEYGKIEPSLIDIDARDIPVFTDLLSKFKDPQTPVTAEMLLKDLPKKIQSRYVIEEEPPKEEEAPKAPETKKEKAPKVKLTRERKESGAGSPPIGAEEKKNTGKKKTEQKVSPDTILTQVAQGSPTAGARSFADSVTSCTRVRIRSAADDQPIETGLTMKDIREPTPRTDANGSSVKKVGDSAVLKSTSELMRNMRRH